MGITFKVELLAKQPVSVKFPKEMITDMDNECEGLGCNRTDFVIEAVAEKLQKSANETEGQVIKDTKLEPKPTLVKIEEPNPQVSRPVRIELDDGRVSTDGGKTWREKNNIAQNIPKVIIKLDDPPEPKPYNPPVTMRFINGQWLPYAVRYST